MVSLFAFLCYAGLSPSGDEFNNVGSSLSVALTAQAMTYYAASIVLRHVLRETYIAHLPVHTHDSVKHALLSAPSEESLFPAEVIQRSFGASSGGFHCRSCRGLCCPRGVRRVLPSLLPLLLSDLVTLLVLNSLLPPLRRASVYQSRGSRVYKLRRLPSPAPRRSPNRSSKSPAEEMANCHK